MRPANSDEREWFDGKTTGTIRQTIYVLMEDELGEALIDRPQPEECYMWDIQEWADWSVDAKQARNNDISLLEERYQLTDPREDK